MPVLGLPQLVSSTPEFIAEQAPHVAIVFNDEQYRSLLCRHRDHPRTCLVTDSHVARDMPLLIEKRASVFLGIRNDERETVVRKTTPGKYGMVPRCPIHIESVLGRGGAQEAEIHAALRRCGRREACRQENGKRGSFSFLAFNGNGPVMLFDDSFDDGQA